MRSDIRRNQERSNCKKKIQNMFQKEANITNWYKKLMTTGSLITPDKRKRVRSSWNEKNFLKVEDHFKERITDIRRDSELSGVNTVNYQVGTILHTRSKS